MSDQTSSSDPFSPALDRLLSSSQLTGPTRQALQSRLHQRPTAPQYFSVAEFALLEQVGVGLVPHDPQALPLAARIDARLQRGDSDGWRYDRLPPDGQAYRQLLASLPADFQTTDDAGRHAALTQAQHDHPQIFEELLAELTEGFYSDPRNQLNIGYVGFADAQGWTATGLDQLDPHELEALTLAGKRP